MEFLGYILGAYGVAALLLAGLIIATWWRARTVNRQLHQHEQIERR